jgi:uncharacterized protein
MLRSICIRVLKVPLAQWICARAASLLIALMVCFNCAATAQDLQVIPPLSARVIDTTRTLDAAQTQALEAKLAAFEKARGAQVVILMVPTTLPEDITDYVQRVGDSWKIGRKGIGDGLLLVVAKNDRKVRIATSKTLEGAVPDLAAKRVIDNAITPRFKQGDFAGGLSAAADQLMALVAGENLPSPAQGDTSQRNTGGQDDGMQFIVLLFFASIMGGVAARSIFGRVLGVLVTGAGLGVLTWFFTHNILLAGLAALAGVVVSVFTSLVPSHPQARSGAWRWNSGAGGGFSGGSSGSVGGGGFSSGGGGDFGGGGSSGSW